MSLLTAGALMLSMVQIQPAPRLRTVLPNGATIFAERVTGETSISVQMILSSRGMAETATTNGFRHLIEHLAAKGPRGDVDSRLELRGMYLTARTLRDAVLFEVQGRGADASTAIKILAEIAQSRTWTQPEISRELKVLEQEQATATSQARLASTAWRVGLGEAGLDPLGDLAVMNTATPEILSGLCARMFSSSNIVVCITGDADVSDATVLAKQSFGSLINPFPVAEFEPRPTAQPGILNEPNAIGEALGVPIPKFNDPVAIRTLAAALTVKEVDPTITLLYTPSLRASLLVLCSDRPQGIREAVTKAREIGTGALAAKAFSNWLDGQLSKASPCGYLRGLLLSGGGSLAPDELRASIGKLSDAEFKSAMDRFSNSMSIVVTGR